MVSSLPITPINYLLIGHLTQDILPDGSYQLGGTSSFAGFTAFSLGHQVGLVTSCSPSIDFSTYAQLQINLAPSSCTTTFRNLSNDGERRQYLYQKAARLDKNSIPTLWKSCPLVHLGPVADEVDPEIFTEFSDGLLCLTPQGWLRETDENHLVHRVNWHYSDELLRAADATVLSLEDLGSDEEQVLRFAELSKLLVVTENKHGCRVYWQGEMRHIPAPLKVLADDTGAGDIFAAGFFHHYFITRDPWQSAIFATSLAATSVTRRYLASIPTPEEILMAESLASEG